MISGISAVKISSPLTNGNSKFGQVQSKQKACVNSSPNQNPAFKGLFKGVVQASLGIETFAGIVGTVAALGGVIEGIVAKSDLAAGLLGCAAVGSALFAALCGCLCHHVSENWKS